MRRWTDWDWTREPDAPRTWTDAAERLIALDGFEIKAGAGKATAAFADVLSRGAVAVMRCAAKQLAYSYDWPENVIPAGVARTKADLDEVARQFIDVHAWHQALWLEPTEPIDLARHLDDPHCRRCRLLGDFSDDRCYRKQHDDVPSWIDWVIVSGTSEPMHPAWVRSIRDQCAAAGVSFSFRGWGDWVPMGQLAESADEHARRAKVCWIGTMSFFRVGRDSSGVTLDGRERDDRPEIAK